MEFEENPVLLAFLVRRMPPKQAVGPVPIEGFECCALRYPETFDSPWPWIEVEDSDYIPRILCHCTSCFYVLFNVLKKLLLVNLFLIDIVALVSPMSHCPHCGKELEPGEEYCGGCNYRVNTRDPIDDAARTVGIIFVLVISVGLSVYELGFNWSSVALGVGIPFVLYTFWHFNDARKKAGR